jgi:acetylornithine deacetylase/succinyl-diaminopimelate desuccinylase-like protein
MRSGIAVEKEEPGAAVVPTCLPIGSNAKQFDRLGICHFGFVPLLLPPSYDFASMSHGVDERVPVSSLAAGSADLAELLRRMLSSFVNAFRAICV